MENDIPGMIGWEMREVPRSDRAPIVDKTLDLIQADPTSSLRLLDLDAMDLLALIKTNGDGEELRALYWLAPCPDRTDEGVIEFFWHDKIQASEELGESYRVTGEAIEDWARKKGLVRIIYYTSVGYKRAKAEGQRIGFKPGPLREFVREIDPLEE
jgi:hypothetical protein